MSISSDLARAEKADLIQKVIGFRSWSLQPFSGYLTMTVALQREESLGLWSAGFGRTRWAPGPNVAKCRRAEILATQELNETRPNCTHPPEHDCDCGLYALHELHELARVDPHTQIIGAVAAWGRLEVHRDGFRAEFVEVVALGLPDWVEIRNELQAERIRKLAALYRVPCVRLAELKDAAMKHGIRVPEELYPAEEEYPSSMPLSALRTGGLMALASSYHAIPTGPGGQLTAQQYGAAIAKLGRAVLAAPSGGHVHVALRSPPPPRPPTRGQQAAFLFDLFAAAVNLAFVFVGAIWWLSLVVAIFCGWQARKAYRDWLGPWTREVTTCPRHCQPLMIKRGNIRERSHYCLRCSLWTSPLQTWGLAWPQPRSED